MQPQYPPQQALPPMLPYGMQAMQNNMRINSMSQEYPAYQTPATYAEGTQNNFPPPMLPAPASTMPALFPSFVNPQTYPPSPFPNSNLLQARYKRGGSVLSKIGREIGRAYKRYGHIALPVLGGVAGTALGGPLGGAIGGGLGGALGAAKGNRLQNALLGSAAGGALGFAGPYLGNALGVAPNGIAGRALGMNPLFGGIGRGAAGATLPAAISNAAVPSASAAATQPVTSRLWDSLAGGATGIGSKLSEAFTGKDAIPNSLLAAAILGTIFRKENTPAYGENVNATANAMFTPAQQPRNYSLAPRAIQNISGEYIPGESPEHRYFENINPEVQYFNHGGYLDGDTGGADDKIDAKLSDGEYVINANTVSQIGDGNNKAGASRLNKFVDNILKHKKVEKLPPKTKSLMNYMPRKAKG